MNARGLERAAALRPLEALERDIGRREIKPATGAKRGRGARGAKTLVPVPLEGLTRARVAAGETQERAGERVGMTKAHLSKVEAGTTRLDVARAAVLARAYGVSVESFLPQWAAGDCWPPVRPD